MIVRRGANVSVGARERLSALTHGTLLLGAVLFAGALLNRIALAALAVALIHVGLKLCAPELYAAAVARVHTDAKGALAHATLAQVGLMLAEISLGLTRLAIAHLVCHALQRAYQYLRAPNMIHDVHQHGHFDHGASLLARITPRLATAHDHVRKSCNHKREPCSSCGTEQSCAHTCLASLIRRLLHRWIGVRNRDSCHSGV